MHRDQLGRDDLESWAHQTGGGWTATGDPSDKLTLRFTALDSTARTIGMIVRLAPNAHAP